MSTKTIVLRSAPLYAVADATAELETECLFGEQFEVNAEISKSESRFVFGRLTSDGYEGWVPSAALGDLPAATHRLSVLASWVRENENIKSQSLMLLSMGSLITVKGQEDNINQVALPLNTHGYIPESHMVSSNELQRDWVSVAESFLGVPYRWGGRTHSGLDCSALVQLSAQSAQLSMPRNSSQQQAHGTAVESVEQLQRGDLVFWKCHVGVMQSGTQLLHANAHHMQVASEPLLSATARIKQKEGSITAMKRLAILGCV
ncbi:MAG: C40 family peptidase [Granulosicoccaceae bacterium]